MITKNTNICIIFCNILVSSLTVFPINEGASGG